MISVISAKLLHTIPDDFHINCLFEYSNDLFVFKAFHLMFSRPFFRLFPAFIGSKQQIEVISSVIFVMISKISEIFKRICSDFGDFELKYIFISGVVHSSSPAE